MLGALIGSVAGLAGSLFQNSANKAAADKQMAFQKETLTHQYQYAMDDMKKAGLNPMLAYQQGGSGSAAGASYQAQNVGEAAVRGASEGTNSANASRLIKSQIENMAADTALKKSNEKAASAAVVQSLANAQLANANSATVTALRPYQTATAMYDSNRAMADMGIRGNDLIASNVMRDYLKTDAGKLARMFALGGQDVAQGSSAFKLWK